MRDKQRSAVPQPGRYRERLRPQFHFTAQRGWLNDPNGLVHYRGEYHLFFQHDPHDVNPREMHWGHAMSQDLVHWQELPIALYPDEHGPCWSGSAVVDWDNTAGLQRGAEKTLVALYTAAGDPAVQCLAYSADRGRTWEKCARNPVLGHIVGVNRDPKVVWDAERRRWVMALYLDGNDYALFASPDLKEWSKLSNVIVPDSGECPDFFPMPVEGEPGARKWVFTAANGHYLVGSFDGVTFVPEQEALPCDWGANFYAVQTFSDVPAQDGRRIQLAWMNGGAYPGMPFNQQMSFPCKLRLRRGAQGLRLCRYPVGEIAKLWEQEHRRQDATIGPGRKLRVNAPGGLFDVEGDFEVPEAAILVLEVRGHEVRYDGCSRTLSCLGRDATLAPAQGRVRLRVLADRTSLEVFGSDGEVSLISCCLPIPGKRGVAIQAEGAPVTAISFVVRELKSAWQA